MSGFLTENSLVFSQLAAEDKANEIVAIPKLPALLDLHGASGTIDAVGCQTAIAQQIIDQSGDYLLTMKDNQSTPA